MVIQNAMVYQDNNEFEVGSIYIKGDRIVQACTQSVEETVLDASGLYAVPGLTDIHLHGCNGHDFCEGTKEAFDAITRYQLNNGVTTICLTTMTLPEEELLKICNNAKSYANNSGSTICGINLEGPFLSEKKKGAQNGAYLHKPDTLMFQRLQKASGDLVKLISIAPEVEGAMAFLSQMKDEAVLAIAHTNADYETTKEAFLLGASHVTHLYNAMPAFHHRDPGVIGAAFDAAGITVEVICDGIHLHPSVVRATIKMFGRERVIFVSDSMMACGLRDGIYSLGGQEVAVSDKTARLTKDATIAGSVTNLMDCVRTAVKEMGIPLEHAIQFATMNPAKLIGIDQEYGSISPGKVANIVLLDRELQIKAIIFKGKPLDVY